MKRVKFALGINASILLIILICIKAKWSVLMNLDNHLLDFIHVGVTPTMTSFFIKVTQLGSPEVTAIVGVLLAAFWFFRDKWQAVNILGMIIGGDAFAFVIKEVVQRVRPTHQIFADTGYSTPSGHVLGVCLLVLIIWTVVIQQKCQLKGKVIYWLVAIFMVALVLYSRLYLHVHYPSDVIASIFTGITWWLIILIVTSRRWWPGEAFNIKDRSILK